MLFITSFAVLIAAEPISPAAPNPKMNGTTAKAIYTIISTYLALAAEVEPLKIKKDKYM
jgi:hypothetical protein